MFGYNCFNNQSAGHCSAAACTSAPMIPLLDTAVSLVVSICVVCLSVVRIIQTT